MRKPLSVIAALIVLFTALPATALPAFLVPPSERTLSFEVLRNGGSIGFHTYAFHPRPNGFEVRVEADIRVSFLLIPFFVFEQKGVEIWENGHFRSLDYTTNDDGIRHWVKADVKDGRMRVTVDGKPAGIHPVMIPGSLWHPPSPSHTMMLDPGDGRPAPLKIQLLGEETLAVRGKPTRTTRWLWDDGLRREMWYDGEQTLVQIWIRGDDGSDIYYVLK